MPKEEKAETARKRNRHADLVALKKIYDALDVLAEADPNAVAGVVAQVWSKYGPRPGEAA